MSLETQSIVGQSAPATNTSAGASNPTDASVISSDFETFLRLLTAQLENQDPLNPIESQDFAVQLATFSGVEQQVQTNDLLRDLTTALGTSDLAQLADWVGMEARVVAPVALRGSPVDVVIEPETGTDQAEMVVRDEQGLEVARESVPVAGGSFPWAGRDANGQPLADGTYTLELVSIAQGEILGVKTVPHYADVTEARRGSGGIELIISGGAVVSSDSVTSLRRPAES